MTLSTTDGHTSDRIMHQLMREAFQSFWQELKRSAANAATPGILAFYGVSILVFIFLSVFLPYETQVYLSIAAGVGVAILLTVSTILFRRILLLDIVFVGGIVFLVAALFKRGLLPPTVLQNFGHYALVISLALTGSYVVLQIIHCSRIGSHAGSLRSFNEFFSVSFTTLSSEMCSCLHPIPFLDLLGVVVFLPNQVRLGFIVMMATLVYQARLTFESYKSRKRLAVS